MYTQYNISKTIMYSYRFMLPLNSYSRAFLAFIMHKTDCHFSVVIVLSSEIKYDCYTECVIFNVETKLLS